MDGNAQEAIRHFSAHNEKRILQIDLVLGSDPLVGEFAECENRKLTRAIRRVGDFHTPVFEFLASGTK